MNNDLMAMLARDHIADLDREVEANGLVAQVHAVTTPGRPRLAALRRIVDRIPRLTRSAARPAAAKIAVGGATGVEP